MPKRLQQLAAKINALPVPDDEDESLYLISLMNDAKDLAVIGDCLDDADKSSAMLADAQSALQSARSLLAGKHKAALFMMEQMIEIAAELVKGSARPTGKKSGRTAKKTGNAAGEKAWWQFWK